MDKTHLSAIRRLAMAVTPNILHRRGKGWPGKDILLMVVVLMASSLWAEPRQVTGYGSGDNLLQALVVAQGDAVLNAGARTTVEVKSSGDRLLSDVSTSSNALFMTEYKILEKGESFDGVYVRILATTCDISERKFNNGSFVTGNGIGGSERAARIAAIGDAIMSIGTFVRAIGVYEKDELVRDETELTGCAYVSDIEETMKSSSDGVYSSKVRIKVFSDKETAGGRTHVEKLSSGVGRDVIEAMADARVNAIVDFEAPYEVRTTYKSGILYSKIIKHNWHGFCYGAKVVGKQQMADGWKMTLSFHFIDDLNGNNMNGITPSVGFGNGKTNLEALEQAKWDAVINSGSLMECCTTYEDGKKPKEQMHLAGSGYIGKCTSNIISAGSVQMAEVNVPVSHSEEDDAQCELTQSTGVGCAPDIYKAFLLARLRALANGGARYRVDRLYVGNNLVSNMCEVTTRRDACEFVIEDHRTSSAGAEVQVRMNDLSSNESNVHATKGFGVATSKAAACELARGDAALNFCSTAATHTRHEMNRMIEFCQNFHGGAYLANCNTTVVPLPDGRFLASAMADAVRNSSDANRVLNRPISFEGKHELSMSSSICATRRGLIIKAGAIADVSVDYRNFDLQSASTTYRSEGILSECLIDVSRHGDNQYASKASGRVLPKDNFDRRTGLTVIGYGNGASFEEARKTAVEDALINANARFSAEEKFELGKYVSGRAEFAAEGYLFGIELLQNKQGVDKNYAVKVKCDFSSSRGNELNRSKKKVEAKGWGVNEAMARADAERNAIDIMFGRHVTVTLKEVNGRIVAYSASHSVFENGFVEKSEVTHVIQKSGLYEVAISAVVCQRNKTESGWGWGSAVIVMFVLVGIIRAAKAIEGKGLSVVMWLVFSIALFAMGHWVVGLAVAIIGFGMCIKR